VFEFGLNLSFLESEEESSKSATESGEAEMIFEEQEQLMPDIDISSIPRSHTVSLPSFKPKTNSLMQVF